MLLQLVVGFLPWIILAVLADRWLAPALVLALAAASATAFRHWRGGRLKIMDVVTCAFFALMVVAIVLFRWIALASYLALLANAALMALAWGSLLAGVPFTLQYARERTPPELWQTAPFIRINRYITAVWGLDFFLSALVSLYRQMSVDTGLVWKYLWILFVVGATWFTVKFPAWYRAHAGGAGDDAAAQRGRR